MWVAYLCASFWLALSTSACSASQVAKVALKTVPTQALQSALMELPTELIQANFNLSVATRNLIKKATELPAPGTIALSDLGAELKPFEGKSGADFLNNAKDEHGKAIDFRYARFNEPTYDAFLKQAMLAKALSHQTLCTVRAMVKLSTDILGETISAGPSLHRTVERALVDDDASSEQKRRLERLQRLGRSLGVLVPRYAVQAQGLARAGQELVSNASQVFANTTVLMHLPEVTRSLTTSMEAIAATGRWTGQVALSLRGFARPGDGKRPKIDVEEGRLARDELAALLFEPQE